MPRVLLLFFHLISLTVSQVPSIFPSRYLYPTAETMSVNGSSPDGKCSSTSRYNNSYSTCEAPTSSVLFDSTLTGLDGDMWASQLLTLQIHNPGGKFLVSDFNGTSNYVRVGRVELVMFNCPELGVEVERIGIWRAPSISGARVQAASLFPAITSCDSLVRVCTASLDITTPVVVLQFTPAPGSNMIYLAEVEFYGDSSACSPDTIITRPPPANTTTPPPPDTMATASRPSDTTTSPSDNTPSMHSSSSTIVIAASIGCVVLLIVCLLAAVLILWRCYYVKHHKHNTSHHPAVGEGHINTHSHPPPVTLCEETGQVYYSTPQEVVPQESSDTYSHIHHDTITGRGASKKSREGTVAEGMEMGGYSMLSYGDKPRAYSSSEVCEKKEKRKKESKKMSADATVDQLYAQVEKKKKKDGDTTHPHPWPSEDDTPVDQLYAQVEKKKKKKDGDTTRPHPPETDTPVDQLYAQVDKKKNDGDTTHPHPPEADTSVDQLYAQVDKKKESKGKEVCEYSPKESGAVYSVVSKPHPPQVPAKSDLLMDDLYN